MHKTKLEIKFSLVKIQDEIKAIKYIIEKYMIVLKLVLKIIPDIIDTKSSNKNNKNAFALNLNSFLKKATHKKIKVIILEQTIRK